MSKIIDETGNRTLIKQLEEIGLSEKEALVYIALLPRQDTGTSKLIQATGLHGQFVYVALAKLEELGLAKHVIQNGRKKFSANTPNRLLSLVEEKRLVAQAVAKELHDRFAGKHEQDFEIYQGDTAFMTHQIALVRLAPQGSSLDVIASENERYSKTFKELGFWDEYNRVRAEKKIRIRYLGTESQREWLKKREIDEEPFEYRVLPGLKLGKMSIEVRADNVTFATYGDVLLDFTLTSKEIAESYQEFFNAVWALAQK